MPGPWKEWKSKSSFSTHSTVPWESRKRREIPTFPQPGFATAVLTSNQEARKMMIGCAPLVIIQPSIRMMIER
jgi:hypothetical protein